MGVLHLVPIYCGSSRILLAPLAAQLAELFSLRVDEHPPGFDPELAFDATRGQYNSRILLAQLLKHHAQGAVRVLGVVGVDLFIPVLTYVFGEAQLEGPTAVVSTYRLDNELYGLPSSREQLFERLVKETVHELGHTFNLLHCHRHPCVMISSMNIDAIDQKSDRFCDACRASLRQSVPGDASA